MNTSNTHHGSREASVNPDDDWRFVSDRRVRKRIQNKLSQRKHRARVRSGSDVFASSLATSPAVSASSHNTQPESPYNKTFEGSSLPLSTNQSPVSAVSPSDNASTAQTDRSGFESLPPFPGSWDGSSAVSEAATSSDRGTRGNSFDSSTSEWLRTGLNDLSIEAPVDRLAQSLITALSKGVDQAVERHSQSPTCDDSCASSFARPYNSCEEPVLVMALRTICSLLKSQLDKTDFVCTSCRHRAGQTIESGTFQQIAGNTAESAPHSLDALKSFDEFIQNTERENVSLGAQPGELDQFCSYIDMGDDFWASNTSQDDTASSILF